MALDSSVFCLTEDLQEPSIVHNPAAYDAAAGAARRGGSGLPRFMQGSEKTAVSFMVPGTGQWVRPQNVVFVTSASEVYITHAVAKGMELKILPFTGKLRNIVGGLADVVGRTEPFKMQLCHPLPDNLAGPEVEVRAIVLPDHPNSIWNVMVGFHLMESVGGSYQCPPGLIAYSPYLRTTGKKYPKVQVPLDFSRDDGPCCLTLFCEDE